MDVAKTLYCWACVLVWAQPSDSSVQNRLFLFGADDAVFLGLHAVPVQIKILAFKFKKKIGADLPLLPLALMN